MRSASILALAACIGLFRATASAVPADIVVATTIQAAVDAAQPGDTIRVPPGVYHESVLVTKDQLTIVGAPGAILDGDGTRVSGVRVRSAVAGGRVDGFTLTGLQVQHYVRNGVILLGVDHFWIDHGTFLDNGEYGIFPIFSSDGVMAFNHVSGSKDTGIYIGQSMRSVIEHNEVTRSTVGIDVELSTQIAVRHNDVRHNTIGLTAQVLPGLTASSSSDIEVIDNDFIENNQPNPVTDPDEILAQLPHGIGILVIGADRVVARNNRVLDNDSAGVAIIQLPPSLAALDPRIDPFPDNNHIADNIAFRNGRAPDPKLAPFPGADLLWDGSGFGNCWSGNRFRASVPVSLPLCAQ
jgi:parallel beta-helix repeat protein